MSREIVTDLSELQGNPDACIQVMSRVEAERIFREHREGKYAAMISIGDPGSYEPWFVEEAAARGLEVLRLEFEDVEDLRLEWKKGGAPDREDVRMIVSFLDEVLTGIGSQCVLIHCEMGISRSAAAAVLGWELLGYSFDEAVAKTLEGRPIADPNTLMLELAR